MLQSTACHVPTEAHGIRAPRDWECDRIRHYATVADYSRHCYSGGMALPGLVRVSFVATMLGVSPRTARSHLMRAGCTPIRRPRVTSKDRDGPWYVSVEDSVRLIDWLLPRVVQAAANRRARRRLAQEADLMGASGQCVTYKTGGTGSEAGPAETRPASPATKIPVSNL